MNTESTGFTWLHLTDLHVGMTNQEWLWPSVKSQLLKDLETIHQLSGDWDAVVFSGDLVQSGMWTEYEKLDNILSELWELFDKLKFRPTLISLPGNHDLQRPALNGTFKTLRRWWDESDIHEEFFSDDKSEYRQAVESLFVNYLRWRDADKNKIHASGLNGLLPGDASYELVKNTRKVGIVCLNSTWLQFDNADYEKPTCRPAATHATG